MALVDARCGAIVLLARWKARQSRGCVLEVSFFRLPVSFGGVNPSPGAVKISEKTPRSGEAWIGYFGLVTVFTYVWGGVIGRASGNASAFACAHARIHTHTHAHTHTRTAPRGRNWV